MSARPRNKPEWQDTWLWKTLLKRAKERGNDGASEFLPTLTEWMKLLDGVLSGGGTAPLDFTLHDAAHSLRVAHRIGQLVTPSVQRNISDYELALLLLAAYGHDIGMTPARRKVQAHHRHLFDPEHSTLTQPEKDQFQKFLDDYHDRPVSLPLCTGAPTADDLNLADELTAFYVRERHNDWSAEWLRDNLKGNLYFLNDAVETLVRLCSSHHWGFDRLAQEDFAPRRIGSPHPQILHLRHLACLLRLADILENDPERTPEVIFRHRSIEERQRSVIHWQKDHALTIDFQGDHIRFEAHPRSARVHKALVQLADWIDHELHGIAAFGEKLPDHFAVGRDNIRRQWHLAPALKRHIEPAPGTYEYIDGAFRPNTQRLLQLLSGEQLYGEPLAAVRELLQNAFDAVREKIARRRLEPGVEKPGDPALEKRFGDEERVILTLQRREVKVGGQTGTEHWLVCEDSGVGLTKALITGHLLVSGQSRRHDIMALERRCEEIGFRLGRTGQFGIGVLSYFMLASEVRLVTVRFQACGDQDSVGWSFATHGVGDFGELKKLDRSPVGISGTRVELRLRPEKCGDPEKLTQDLLAYLRKTLLRIPCTFRCKTEGFAKDGMLWEVNTGWTATLEDHLARAQSDWREPEDLKFKDELRLTAEGAEAQRTVRECYPGWLEQARKALRCASREVELPEGLGHALLLLPYFDLPEGPSLAFLFRDGQGFLRTLNPYQERHGVHELMPGVWQEFAWKGMACELKRTGAEKGKDKAGIGAGHCIAELLDFARADEQGLTVNRDHLRIRQGTEQTINDALGREADALIRQTLAFDSPRFYHALNLHALRRPFELAEGMGCIRWAEGKKDFAGAAFPMIGMSRYGGSLPKLKDSRGRSFFPAVVDDYGGIATDTPEWPAPAAVRVAPSRSGGSDRQIPRAIWEQPVPDGTGNHATSFPPEWRLVAYFHFAGDQRVINPAYPLYPLLSESHRGLLRNGDFYNTDLQWEEFAAAQPPADAAWLLYRLTVKSLERMQPDWLENFLKRHPSALKDVWSLAGKAVGLPESDFRMAANQQESEVRIATGLPEKWSEYDGDQPPLLPKVTDEEWILRPEKGDGQETVSTHASPVA